MLKLFLLLLALLFVQAAPAANVGISGFPTTNGSAASASSKILGTWQGTNAALLSASNVFNIALRRPGFSNVVHIASRTDGVAGDGSERNPYDASTVTKFDLAVSNAFGSGLPTTIRLGPGTFYTYGFENSAAASNNSVFLKSNCRIIGSGMDITTLKLQPSASNVNVTVLFSAWQEGGAWHDGAVSDLTIDGNYQAVTNTNCLVQGVILESGTHGLIERVRFKNGSDGTNGECFMSGSATTNGAVVDCVYEGNHRVRTYGTFLGLTLIQIGQNNLESRALARGNRVLPQTNFAGVATCNAIGVGGYHNAVEGNFIQGHPWMTGVYVDSSSVSGLRVRGNYLENCAQGVFLWGSWKSTNTFFTDNVFRLSTNNSTAFAGKTGGIVLDLQTWVGVTITDNTFTGDVGLWAVKMTGVTNGVVANNRASAIMSNSITASTNVAVWNNRTLELGNTLSGDAANSLAGNVSFGNGLLYVSTNFGGVGIGIQNPFSALDIRANGYFGSPAVTLYQDATNYTVLAVGGNSVRFDVNSDANNHFSWYRTDTLGGAATELMRLTTAGDVNITGLYKTNGTDVPFNLATFQASATNATATAGANTLPANPLGFLTATLTNGVSVKIPYYKP